MTVYMIRKNGAYLSQNRRRWTKLASKGKIYHMLAYAMRAAKYSGAEVVGFTMTENH